MVHCRPTVQPIPCNVIALAELNAPSASDPANIDALAENARQSAQTGQLQLATSLYTQLLQLVPGHPDALNFFGTRALNSEQFSQSIELFQRALATHSKDASLHKNLGLAYRGLGALPEALAAFDTALHIRPGYPAALLHRAAILEQLGRHQEALNGYLAALSQADKHGWLAQAAGLPSGLRHVMQRAIAAVQQARQAYLTQALMPLRAKHGAQALARVDRCLRIYLGKEPLPAAHPQQRCTLMTFPDIPAQAWFEHGQFPWLAEIEGHTDEIRAELKAVLKGSEGFRPFITIPRDHAGAKRWEALNDSPDWNAFFFYRDGQRYDENCKRCSVTSALLDNLPLSRMAGHSPEIFFSVLKPGAHIPPHTGVINVRLVVHLPLIIPPDCGIRVGNITRDWKESECIVFDDTFEHEAWNHSDQTRVVLIFDIWNPYLTPTEQEAMRIVVEELGRFNQLHGQDQQRHA